MEATNSTPFSRSKTMQLSAPWEAAEQPIFVSAIVGSAPYLDDGTSSAELFRADDKLTDAQKRGASIG